MSDTCSADTLEGHQYPTVPWCGQARSIESVHSKTKRAHDVHPPAVRRTPETHRHELLRALVLRVVGEASVRRLRMEMRLRPDGE